IIVHVASCRLLLEFFLAREGSHFLQAKKRKNSHNYIPAIRFVWEKLIMHYELLLICVTAEDGLEKTVLVFSLGVFCEIHLMLLFMKFIEGNKFPLTLYKWCRTPGF
ncbi:MAG: hypothetical protein J6Y69_08020, partial [Treponema sp.]|nr:hypothetical protein [Treponema sp.]